MILSLAALATFALPAAAQEYREAYPSYIQITGRAEKEIVPDLFYLSVTINEKDSKGKLSVESQQRDMVAALKKIGIDTEKQLTVANRSSEFYRKATSLAMARYQLELHSAAEVDKVLAALTDLGISNAAIQRVSHSGIEAYKQQVRIEAMRNARESAASLAEAVGQNIGDCIYIYDANSSVVPAVYNNAIMTRSAMKAAYDSLEEVAEEESPEFKTIKLEYSVQAKFILKGSRGNALPMN